MPVIKKTKANYPRPAQSWEILEISQPLIYPISGTYWHTLFSWTKGPDKLVSVTPVPKNSSWGQGHLDKSKLGYGHRPGEVDWDHNQQKTEPVKHLKRAGKCRELVISFQQKLVDWFDICTCRSPYMTTCIETTCLGCKLGEHITCSCPRQQNIPEEELKFRSQGWARSVS